MAVFTADEIQKYAFAAVVEDGRRHFNRGKVLNLNFIGDDIIASVRGERIFKVVISRENESLRFGCNCGFSYGGACDHVVAVMLAANEHQAIQIGINWDTPVAEAEQQIKTQDRTEENIENDSEYNVPADSENLSIVEVETGKPVGRLYLSESDSMLLVELRFAYHQGMVEFNRTDTSVFRLIPADDGNYYRIYRSKARESAMSASLTQFELMRYQSGIYTPVCDPRIWILQELPRIAKDGYEIYGQEKLTTTNARKTTPKLSVSISAGESVFDCTVTVSFDGITATLAELIMAVKQGSRFIRLTDGTSGIIPQQWLDTFAGLFAALEVDTTAKSLTIKNSHLTLANLLFDMADECKIDDDIKSKMSDLQNFKGIVSQPLPKAFNAMMRPYQLAGYEWFYFLRKYNFGGCLADDMGLGKTVQTLALLMKEREAGIDHLSLVIVPTSLLFNWQREAEKFTPELRILLFHGAGRQKNCDAVGFADVILTSYGTVLRDIEFFKEMKFHYIILDEAQAIKNPASQISHAIKQLNGTFRLALSGTPIENNLAELWSMFSFLNPGMLGSYRNFAHNFVKPIEREFNECTADVLRKLIFPFVLRRTKEQVAKDLPPKTEITVFVDMHPKQRTVYEITRDTYRGKIVDAFQNVTKEQSTIQVLEGLLRLRQICCHPRLIDSSYSDDSGKFQTVLESIEDVVSEGHRILVFSQFVSSLVLLQSRIAELGIATEILTGSTRDRQAVVDRFQNASGAPVFLISLKAGGTGLNLTSADYVIHLDPWWNPSSENQASDRAYRIGQTRPVFVYKMITRDSIEERIQLLQERKKALVENVIQTESTFFKQLSKDDIIGLFS